MSSLRLTALYFSGCSDQCDLEERKQTTVKKHGGIHLTIISIAMSLNVYVWWWVSVSGYCVLKDTILCFN